MIHMTTWHSTVHILASISTARCYGFSEVWNRVVWYRKHRRFGAIIRLHIQSRDASPATKNEAAGSRNVDTYPKTTADATSYNPIFLLSRASNTRIICLWLGKKLVKNSSLPQSKFSTLTAQSNSITTIYIRKVSRAIRRSDFLRLVNYELCVRMIRAALWKAVCVVAR